ncbi:MAG: hypothetical protein M1431_07925 [Candidatus Thermoplasmatota archaeon]|nr:hypothetical protein [Candidatus Thermoplasmatota archaeon]
MPFNPAQIDKITDELRSFLRVEVRSRKPKKLDPAFYRNITSALETLKDEAQQFLSSQDIDSYIRIKERISDIERDFRAFFQKRFEKIATLSLYDLDGETMNSLTPEEKEFIIKLHNLMYDEYNSLLNKIAAEPELHELVEQHAPVVEPQVQANVPETHIEAEIESSQGQRPEERYIPVRIIGDQPPIAQPDRDYFLHDNDIIYLPEKFADLLIKRKSAVEIKIK